MIYFQNPNNDQEFISWNGSCTFHHGYFDRHGAFIPDEVWNLCNKEGKSFSFEFIKDYIAEIFSNANK